MINLELATRTKRIEEMKNVAISKLIITLKAKTEMVFGKGPNALSRRLMAPFTHKYLFIRWQYIFSRNRNTLVFVIFQFVFSLKLFSVMHPRL